MPGLDWEQNICNTNSSGASEAFSFISKYQQHHPGLSELLQGPKFPAYAAVLSSVKCPLRVCAKHHLLEGQKGWEIRQTLRRLKQSRKIMTAPASAGNRCANFPAQQCQCSSLLTATHLLAENCVSLCQGCPPHRVPATALLCTPRQCLQWRGIKQNPSLLKANS